MQIRQGDILLVPIKKIEGKFVSKGERVLAYGEKTGHKHVLEGNNEYYDNGNGLLVAVKKESLLTHQEHENINVPAGEYLIVQQREYNLIDGVRKVMD